MGKKEKGIMMNRKQYIGLVLVLFSVCAVFLLWYCFREYISFTYIQRHSVALLSFTKKHSIMSPLLYILLFVSVISFSLPLTGPLTLLGGFLFGVIGGSLLSILGATIGATTAFLVLKSQVPAVLHDRYGKRLHGLQKKMNQHGVLFLLLMHFSMMVPYFFINVLAALAEVRLIDVIWTTALGFIPLAVLYTFAGEKLMEMTSMNDVFSTNMIIVFVIFVALFFLPLCIRRWRGGALL